MENKTRHVTVGRRERESVGRKGEGKGKRCASRMEFKGTLGGTGRKNRQRRGKLYRDRI